MTKKITSVFLSILIALSTLCTVSLASTGTKFDAVTSATLTDASFVRKSKADVNQYGDKLVLDNNSYNKRIPLLKFDLSDCSIDEIESCDRAELVLKHVELAFGGVDVSILDESLNAWSGTSVTYNSANSAGMLTGGTKINTNTGTYSDSTSKVTITLNGTAIANALKASGSKIITFRLDPLSTASSAWVFNGMASDEAKRPKLNFVTEVDIEQEMQLLKDSLDFSLISSDGQSSVTQDLDFETATSGKYGIKIEWSSLNEDVVASDGSVIRPIENFGETDSQATIRATISYPTNPSVSPITRDFDITVPARSLTAAEFVEEEKKAISFEKIKGSNISADSVTENLDFSYQGIYDGTSITYTSSDPAVASDGTVTRPQIGSPDATVAITAHISNGGATDEQTITVIVPTSEIHDNLLLTKEVYASAKAIISKTKRDVAETRNELVVSNMGNERFSFVRFDLSELNDEELSGIDSSILRLYTTTEALTVNSNFVVSIVDDSLEAYLEADSSAATYNTCLANGLLAADATTVLYDSGNVLQAGQNYETADFAEAVKANLNSSSNKIIWLKVESTTGTIVFGSIKASDASMRPTLKLKYLMTKAQRDIESLSLPHVVTQNLDLRTTGDNGTEITWSTSDDAVVTSDGVVNRFDIGENYALEDTVAILTATASNSWATYTKDFDIRIKMGGVIDATADASIGASASLIADAELTLGGSDEYMSALIFSLEPTDK
ncbi:MAG: DNRLRE domain-containing protein [Clostridia bacterium]|nr:DNRLRE domain-containing protein [Clostridia bacterium]